MARRIAAVVIVATSPLWTFGERVAGIAGPIVAGIAVYFAVWISHDGISQRVEGHTVHRADGSVVTVEVIDRTFDGPLPLAIGIAVALLCLIPAAIGVRRAVHRADALDEPRRSTR